MFTNFKELEAYVLSHKNKKRIVLANAHDEPALSAVVNAHRRGVVDGTLLGKKDEILALLQEMNEDPAEYEIVDFDGPELDAAKAAVELVRQGKADIPMKGILQTSSFAKAILNRETGLIPASGRRLVSQCGIFEYEGRFMMITDAAINIAPDVDTQIGIVENALPVANALGVELPKVAVLSAVENVTEKMPSTVSAAEIAKRGKDAGLSLSELTAVTTRYAEAANADNIRKQSEALDDVALSVARLSGDWRTVNKMELDREADNLTRKLLSLGVAQGTVTAKVNEYRAAKKRNRRSRTRRPLPSFTGTCTSRPDSLGWRRHTTTSCWNRRPTISARTSAFPKNTSSSG